MSRISAVFPLLALTLGGVRGHEEHAKFLIVSAPLLHKVVYTMIPESGTPAEPKPLIDSGLKLPQGLCVDLKRSKLLVADPDLKKVLSYSLAFSGDTLRTDGDPTVVAKGIEARWVSIDASSGSVFFTDEANGKIMKVSGEQLRGSSTAAPAVIYDSLTTTHVSAPGGIAVDNFHVYWSNKASGTQAEIGSVVRGLESADNAAVLAVAANADKVYGVCLSENNIFYTAPEKNIYGVKKKGSAIAVVSDAFQEPRGCAWDGDGTVYVADKKAGTVSSFAGNMASLAPTPIVLVVNLEGAFGVAIVSDVHQPAYFWSRSSGPAMAVLVVLASSLAHS